ncbi:MAG: flagellar hook-length control protein FliK [Phycisphaerales bacterium]|nr:flagellar hook-length control protein FliK [Phycisphaerales bacterium]
MHTIEIQTQSSPDCSDMVNPSGGWTNLLDRSESAIPPFSSVLHDLPEDEPDDGLSTPDVSQPLSVGLAQPLQVEAQHLPANSAASGLANGPPGAIGVSESSIQASGVSWPMAENAAVRDEPVHTTPLDSLSRQTAGHGINVDSVASGRLPVALEVERVELALQAGRSSGTDVRALLASSQTSSGATELSLKLDASQRGPELIRSMTTVALRGGGLMRIRLDPPSLGELTVKLSVLRGHVTVGIEATSASGMLAMSGEATALRSALELQGFTVDRMTVSGPRGIELALEHASAEGDESMEEQEESNEERGSGNRHAGPSESEPQTMDEVLGTMIEIEHGAAR